LTTGIRCVPSETLRQVAKSRLRSPFLAAPDRVGRARPSIPDASPVPQLAPDHGFRCLYLLRLSKPLARPRSSAN